jgi:hypothetical protein
MSHVVLLEKPASVVNGDMGYFDANGKFVKVGGSLATGKVPQRQSDGTIQWATLASGMTNPMTTADDIIVGGASGAPARVAKGSNNTVWGVNGSGVLGYKADPAGGGVGTVTGIYGALGLSFDPTQVGAGAAFAAGSQHFIKVPIQRTGTISKVGLMLFVVGSGTAAANCFVSVHNSSGVMLGLSADLATQWTTSVQRFDQWTVTPVGGSTATRSITRSDRPASVSGWRLAARTVRSPIRCLGARPPITRGSHRSCRCHGPFSHPQRLSRRSRQRRPWRHLSRSRPGRRSAGGLCLTGSLPARSAARSTVRCSRPSASRSSTRTSPGRRWG